MSSVESSPSGEKAKASRIKSRAVRFVITDPLARFGLIVSLAAVALALVGPILYGVDPLAVVHSDQLLSPSLAHPFGTDELGRDLFARSMVGLRLSLAIGAGAAVLATIVGVPWGLIAGYVGGLTDRGLMRLADALLAFPVVILAIATAMMLGPGAANATIAIALATVPQLARLVRGDTLSEKSLEYVLASRSIGTTPFRIVFSEILPNTVSTVLVFVAVSIPRAILVEAGLGFLGLSQQPPTPSLGGLVATSRTFLNAAPFYAIFPGALIVVAVAGLTLLGSGIADAINPARRRGFARMFR